MFDSTDREQSVSTSGTVFLFPGQGAQYFHMGRELFEENAVFRGWMRRLDEAAAAELGVSVIETLYDPARSRSEAFDRLRFTHPALYMIEVALAQTLIDDGTTPDAVLGVSLGSFAAAAIAGCIGIEDGLRAVIRQAQAIERHCPPGGMITVLADAALYEDPFLRVRSALAAVNFDGHFAIAAPAAELDAIGDWLKSHGVTHQRLPVPHAFHSPWIDPARDAFLAEIADLSLRQGALPLACCAGAGLIVRPQIGFFWDVARKPIRFRDTVAALEATGPCRYIDVGPSGTLATFLKYALPPTSASSVHATLTPYGRRRDPLALATTAA